MPLVSKALLERRLDALRQAGPDKKKTLLFLGDSVAWGSALREKGLPNWQQQTPGAYLEGGLSPDWRLVELSADGLYATDLAALLDMGLRLDPDAVVVELNYRMLGPDSDAGPKSYSRPWLDPSRVRTFDQRTQDQVVAHWALFRDAEWAAALLFVPSLRDTLARRVDAVFPAEEEDEDGKQALLDLKLRPYYAIGPQDTAHAGLRAVAQIAGALQKRKGPSLVFLTPQNLGRVGDYLDKDAFKKNKGLFAAAGGKTFRDWSQRPPQGAFLDHCHLDGPGNQGLATWILKDLGL